MNIYQKLVEIRKTIVSFTKDAKGYNYNYVSGSQILGCIKSKLDDLGVILESHLLNQNHEQFHFKDKYGKEQIDFLVWGEMKMIWINADDPADRTEIHWQMLGQQDEISKALGSGLTYSERYFLLKYFGTPTDSDDPDSKQPKNAPPQKKEDSKHNQSKEVPTKWQMSKEQQTRITVLAQKKDISLKTKGQDWTGKKSSVEWVEVDYKKVLSELMKLDDKK